MSMKTNKTIDSAFEEADLFTIDLKPINQSSKPKQKKQPKALKVATVFSGIGAPEQGLKRLGVPTENIFACDNGERMISIDYKKEIDYIRTLKCAVEKREYANSLYEKGTKQTNFVKQSYLANYKVKDDNFYEDVMLLDGTDYKGQVDLFVGGSPCQSFSIAGARGGFEDTRGTLFFEYCRLVKEVQPKVFIYENVYGVLTHDKGRTWDTMQNVFSELGYHFTHAILDARNYGIPQGRRRLFVVGFKDEEAFKRFHFPEPIKLDECPLPTMQSMLEDNLKYSDNPKEGMQSIDGVLRPMWDEKGTPDKRYFLSEKLEAYVLSPGTKNFMHYDAKTDLPIARALVKNMGNSYRASVNNYVHTNGKIRHLTMREVHRLMGYPDSYKIVVSKAQAYKQAGNSIVVDVMMHIEEEIIKAMNWPYGKNK